MKSRQEAHDEYERVFGPFRNEWILLLSFSKRREELDALQKVESEKYQRVVNFHEGTPAVQLCIAAQLINEEGDK